MGQIEVTSLGWDLAGNGAHFSLVLTLENV